MHEDKMIFSVDNLFIEKPSFSFKSLWLGIRTFPDYLKQQKFFLLGFAVLWAMPYIFGLLNVDGFWLDVLNFISGANTSRIKTDVLSLIGSSLAKGVILATIIRLFTVKFTLNFDFLKPWLDLFKVRDIRTLAYLLIGLGIGVLSHRMLSINGEIVNSFASILLGLGFIKGMDFIQRQIKQGLSIGILLAVFIGQISSMTILIILGMVMIVIGLALLIQQKYFKKAIKLAVLMFMFMHLLGFPLTVDASLPAYEDLGIEIIYPSVVQVYEPFEIIIRITNPLFKKHVNSISVYPESGDTRLITSSLPYDKYMVNYHGEDEIRFTVQTNFQGSDEKAYKLRIDLSNHHDFQESGSYTDQIIALFETEYFQTTSSVQMDLPQALSFDISGNTPYVQDYSALAVVYHRDKENMGFSEHHIFYLNRDADFYDTFNFEAYLDDNRPAYSREPEYTSSGIQALPEAIKQQFNVDEGAYVTYVKQEDIYSGVPSKLVLGKCWVVVQFAYKVEKVWYLYTGQYWGGNYDAGTDALVQEKQSLMTDVLMSTQIVPKTVSMPAYPIELALYYIPDTESITAGDEENISGAIDEWVDAPVSDPSGAGVVAVGIASSLIAIAAAGLMVSGSSEDSDKKDKREKSYQLVISKSIGNKLKCDQTGTFYAGIYERIVEEDGSITEGMNAELSALIQIDSPDVFVSFSEATMIDNQKAINFMPKSNDEGKRPQNEFTIRCRIQTGQGSHTESVVFALVEDPYIALHRDKFYILNASQSEKAYPISMMDFMKPVDKVTVKAMQSDAPFKLEILKDKEAYQLKIIEKGNQPNQVKQFFEVYNCEIEANNEKEKALTLFDVVVCHEAVLPDFLGKPAEIRGYRVNMESDVMATTEFSVRMGVWNDKEDVLEFKKPDSVEITFEDENKIFDLIGIEVKVNPDVRFDDKINYIANAKVNLPALKNIVGKMVLKTVHQERELQAQVDVDLVPDILQYHANFEKEYQAAKRIIEVYMAERFRARKLEELEKARLNLGLNDLKLFRQKCWSIAEQSILQEAQEYLKDAAWYDEAIATAELLVYIGDIAFDLALAPVGGPIAGFLAANVKNGFIEIVSNVIEHPNKSTYDITYEFVMKRFEQTIGSADGLIEMPKANESKKLIIWLTCYVLYRIGYHWTFDKDDQGNGIGISLSIERGVLDFVGKGAAVLLGDFLEKAGKGRWPEKYSVTSKDQALVNEKVSQATKAGLNALDSAAEKVDDVIGEVVNRLLAYINQLKV